MKILSYETIENIGYDLLKDLDSLISLIQYIKENEYNHEYNVINSLPYLWENTDEKIKEAIYSVKGYEDYFETCFKESLDKGYYNESLPYFEYTEDGYFESWSYEDIKNYYSENLTELVEYIFNFIIKNTSNELKEILKSFDA